ncbi:ATP synthase complex assembly protein atp12 [Rhizophlyctis rosea]|uniref:ATP synthase complex assembly protein atp12 n=1 Tax=Rhizophlyctis rosea TaxID=64517 RepID=A0AAD5SAP9_9FUNG|nr:ATP synthase complex assembly protein atp12 [Rhizophlyctis rosea]
MTSVKQSEEVVAQLRQLIESFDNLTLAAFEKAVLTAKSFVIGLALTQRRITVEEGAIAGRLEVLHQIDRWGEVEDSHDLDREEMKRQLGSVTCVLLKQ